MAIIAFRSRKVSAAMAVIAAGTFVGAVIAPTAASAHYACGSTAPWDYDTTGGHHTITAANMRTGSSTSCSIAGVSYPSQALDYHCYTSGNDGYTWTYVVNVETKKKGWIRDDLLNDGGSYVLC